MSDVDRQNAEEMRNFLEDKQRERDKSAAESYRYHPCLLCRYSKIKNDSMMMDCGLTKDEVNKFGTCDEWRYIA